jgi:hypothetical protein
MTIELPGALAPAVAEGADNAEAATGQWLETAIAITFAMAAVISASFVAVVTSLT